MIRDAIGGGTGTVDVDDEDDDEIQIPSRGSRGTSGGHAAKGDRGEDYSVFTDSRRPNRLSDPEPSDDEDDEDDAGLISTFRQNLADRRDDYVETYEETAEDPRQALADATGITKYMESERGQQRQRELEKADSVWEGFDVAVATGTDFAWDNPNYSIQQRWRDRFSEWTGADSDEELAEQAQAVDEGITERIDETVEGTPLDNRATDTARGLGDTIVGEGIRFGVGATTGIDTEEGDTDARTGAVELTDLAATAATAGGAKVGASGLRTAARSDRAGDVFNVLRRGGDDADDVARTTERATDASRTTERASDSLLPVTRGGDDAFLPATRSGSRGTRGATRARRADRATDATRGGNRVVDRLREIGSRVTRSRTFRVGAGATAAGAGFVGGGAVVSELSDNYEMEDGTVLYKTDTYPETERFDGGVLYRVADGETNETIGYTVVVGVQGRNVLMLDEQGNTIRAPLSVEEMRERAVGAPGGGR